MANSPPFPTKPSAGAGRSWPIVFPLVVFGILFFLALMIVCSGGFMMVGGTQFHPEGFRIRRFMAFRIPVVGIQAGKTSYTDETPPLSQLLVDNGWIARAPLQSPESEWELIEVSGGWKGMPRNLTDYLRDGYKRVNLYEWSEQNPLLAGMLWSEIEKAAQLQLYWMAPELIDKMVDYSRLHPVGKALSKQERAETARENLTAYLLETYKQTEAGAAAAGETELAAGCRKQIERLSGVGVVILKEPEKTEKKEDPAAKVLEKAKSADELPEDTDDGDSKDASN